MNSEIKGKIYEIRGKAIETEGIINEITENVLDYTITQKPLTDIIETNEALIIRIDLPGIKKEDLKVDIGEDRVYTKPARNSTTICTAATRRDTRPAVIGRRHFRG